MPDSLEIKKANIELHRKTAEIFEEKNIELFNKFEQRNLDKRLRKANQTCKKHEVSCDLACGTGNFIERQIPEFGNVIGLDISREMLKICKAKSQGNRAHLLLGDAENLPFRDQIFDIVTMHAALHHFPSPQKCFGEIHRTLAEEGIIYVDHEPNLKRRRIILETLIADLASILGFLFRKHKVEGSPNDQLFPVQYSMADFHYVEGFAPQAMQKQLESIGFHEVKVEFHNTFSSKNFSRYPTSLQKLSLLDNVLDNLPLIRKFSSNICVLARK